MKKISSLILMLFWIFTVRAQDSNFLAKIQNVNSLLEVYDTLSPFDEADDIFEQITDLHDSIIQNLTELLLDSNMLTVNQDSLFGPALIQTHSADRKISFFSLDQKTGGSYHPFTTLLFYRSEKNTHVQNFGESTVSNIEHLDAHGNYYIFDAILFTCTTCIGADMWKLQIQGDSVYTSSIFRYQGRYYYLEDLSYHADNKTLTYSYIDDKEDSIYGSDEVPDEGEAIYVKIQGVFKWTGNNFIEVSYKETELPNPKK